MARSHDSGTLATTATSLALFDLIRENGGATLRTLTAETDLSKSSVYSHLRTLQSHDLVTKEGEQYHIGLRTLWYAEQARTRKPEYELARDAVDELLETLGEESGFAVEENGRAVLLYNATSARASTFRVGETGPMHATAAGKAMLAAYPDERVERILDRHGLPGLTEETVTDRDGFEAELDTIAERGYSTIDQEFVEGMYSLGAPVRYPDGRVFGAIHASAPVYRQTRDQFRESAAAAIQSAAAELEAALAEAGVRS